MSPEKMRPGRQDPEAVAIQALSFLAGRPQELGRFLNLSGIDPADIRRLAGNAAFLGGILDFLLHDEALLLAFAAENDVSPDVVATARHDLDDGRPPIDSTAT